MYYLRVGEPSEETGTRFDISDEISLCEVLYFLHETVPPTQNVCNRIIVELAKRKFTVKTKKIAQYMRIGIG